jgi:hypothetical protein
METLDPLLISVVSACTALVATIAGPLVTLVVAKRQFNATVLSGNRQKWIESLRDLLAEMISLMVAIIVVKSNWPGKWNGGMDAIAANPELLGKLERVVQVQWKIRLLINPHEDDHQELYRTIDSGLKRLQANDARDAETEADIERITALSQAILKREWERVKLGI